MMKWSRRHQLRPSSRTNDQHYLSTSSASSSSTDIGRRVTAFAALTGQRSTRDDDAKDKDAEEDGGSIRCRCERLARNPGSVQRLNSIKQLLLEHSPASRDKLLATEALLSRTRLQRSTFAVVAVIGQQLLDIDHASESVRILEAALRTPHAGADHQRVLACVLSTLAAACWALDRFYASIVYSLRALAVANTQRDNETLCRTYGNLAAMFFTKRCYRLSLRCRRAELFYCLSLPGNRHHRLLTALSNLGHALRANGYHSGAILCHRMCALSAQRSADCVAEARELRNVGAVYEATSRPKTAFHYYSRSLNTSERLGDVAGQARVWLDLGRLLANAAVPKGRPSAATACYRAALRLANSDVAHQQNISAVAVSAASAATTTTTTSC